MSILVRVCSSFKTFCNKSKCGPIIIGNKLDSYRADASTVCFLFTKEIGKVGK